MLALFSWLLLERGMIAFVVVVDDDDDDLN